MAVRAPQCRYFKKVRPAPGGGAAARKPGLGTGRGGDVGTGSRNSLSQQNSDSNQRAAAGWQAQGGYRQARSRGFGSILRLPLHEAVAGFGPDQDVLRSGCRE